MKKVLKVFALVLVVSCLFVSCSKNTSSSGSSGGSSNDTDGSGGVAAGSSNDAGGSSNTATGGSNSDAKKGIKITVTNLSDWGRIYLFLYDKDIFKTVAEAYGDIED